MFREEDLDLARKIVSHISFPENFGSDDDMDTVGYEAQLEDVVNCDYFVTCGVSKLVIVIEDLPFVIKIPFDGRWIWDDDEQESWFSEFNCACDESESDYCWDEYCKTHMIEDAGFSALVPEMEFIGVYGGHSVYVQSKAKPICECSKLNVSKDSLDKAKQTSSMFKYEWVALVYDTYGDIYWNEFVKWIDENDPCFFNDCHDGNYGVDMAGRPVIFDLSGFRD